jgi:hypothetical protein
MIMFLANPFLVSVELATVSPLARRIRIYERTTVMALAVSIKLFADPYSHTFPHERLAAAVMSIAAELAEMIERRHATGEFPRNSFGMVVLDPTAPNWKPSSECILATVAIGPEGEDFLVNGLAKAMEHRDHGTNCGTLVYVQPQRLTDGDFCYGFSVNLEGTIVGGSAQTEAQDAMLCTIFAAELNYRIAAAKKAWRTENPGNRWFCNVNEPSARYTDALANLGAPLCDYSDRAATP